MSKNLVVWGAEGRCPPLPNDRDQVIVVLGTVRTFDNYKVHRVPTEFTPFWCKNVSEEEENARRKQKQTRITSLVGSISAHRAKERADAKERRKKNCLPRYNQIKYLRKTKAAQVTATAELNAVSRMRNMPKFSSHTTVERTPSNNKHVTPMFPGKPNAQSALFRSVVAARKTL